MFLWLNGTHPHRDPIHHRLQRLVDSVFESRLNLALKMDGLRDPSTPALVSVCDAAFALAHSDRGAHFALVRQDPLDLLVSGGVPLGCAVSPEIIEALFLKVSPVHDGAGETAAGGNHEDLCGRLDRNGKAHLFWFRIAWQRNKKTVGYSTADSSDQTTRGHRRPSSLRWLRSMVPLGFG